MTDIEEFDNAASVAQVWVSGAMNRLGWHDRRKAYLACLATLHALRDHLPFTEAIYLGAQLPAVLRGFYYDGWHPAGTPLPLDNREAFFERVENGVRRDPGIDVEPTVRAIFAYLAAFLPEGEQEELQAVLPRPLRALWPA